MLYFFHIIVKDLRRPSMLYRRIRDCGKTMI